MTTSMRRIAGQGQEKTWVRWALAGGSDPGSPAWCPCRRCWRSTPPMLTPPAVTRMPTGRLMTRLMIPNAVPASGISGRKDRSGSPVTMRTMTVAASRMGQKTAWKTSGQRRAQ